MVDVARARLWFEMSCASAFLPGCQVHHNEIDNCSGNGIEVAVLFPTTAETLP